MYKIGKFIINFHDVFLDINLLVEETGVHRENHRPVGSHWQTVSHKIVSSTPHQGRNRIHNVSDDKIDWIGELNPSS
jgi:hypothetical protein